MADHRDRIGCGCPRLDARDCSEHRSGKHVRWDDDSDWDDVHDDECQCACHGEYEADMEELREFLASGTDHV